MKTILYLQYFEPAAFPPLERSAWQFLDLGWRVHFLGVVSEGHATNFELTAHPNLTYEFVRLHGRRLDRIRYVMAALRNMARLRPDIVYCSQERVYPLGLIATLLPNIKTVLHEHDSPWAKGSQAPTLLAAIRERFARRATVCVIPQDDRAIEFRKATGASRVLVAYNCPALLEVGPLPRPARRQGVILWHHGSIGPGRLPMTLVEALARVPDDVELRFAGYETVNTRGYIDSMKARAAELGVASRVRYLGAIPGRDALYAAASEADVGTALFTTQFAEPMVGASNKPFDFLACGLPLLVNDTEEWRGFFVAEGVAQSCDPQSPDDIARAILWFRDHPDERVRMAEHGHAMIKDRWNYERCFEPVLLALGVTNTDAAGRVSSGF